MKHERVYTNLLHRDSCFRGIKVKIDEMLQSNNSGLQKNCEVSNIHVPITKSDRPKSRCTGVGSQNGVN